MEGVKLEEGKQYKSEPLSWSPLEAFWLQRCWTPLRNSEEDFQNGPPKNVTEEHSST